MNVAQRGDVEASSQPELLTGDMVLNREAVATHRAQLLWSLAARLAGAEQQIDAATDVLMDHGYMEGAQDLREAVEDA